MIEFETVDALTKAGLVRHGFFGRRGGVSTGEFAGLNVSVSTGDDSEAVAHNRSLVAEALGGGPLITLKQVHSARVVTVADDDLTSQHVEADAFVTRRRNVLLGILTADCAPLLLVDSQAGTIGAAHAGWRGAVDGILANTVQAMEAIGADRKNITLAIGPTISGRNYEVGQKFKADVLMMDVRANDAFFTPESGQPHFNLPAFLVRQAKDLGVDVVDTALCTYAQPERFFSHRYATHQGTRTGRQIAVIGLS